MNTHKTETVNAALVRLLAQETERTEFRIGERCPSCKGTDCEDGCDGEYRCYTCENQWNRRDWA